jgi:hypothetical protein
VVQVVRAGRPLQGARDFFLRGPARPVRPLSTRWTASTPWAAKATLRPDLLPGSTGAARGASPPVPRAATAPRTRAAARIGSSAGQPNRCDVRQRRRAPHQGVGLHTRRGRPASRAPKSRPLLRSGPVAPGAFCLVWSCARCPFDMASLAKAIVWQAPSQRRCAPCHFPSRKQHDSVELLDSGGFAACAPIGAHAASGARSSLLSNAEAVSCSRCGHDGC